MNVGIIGCGHMGSAIAKALLAQKGNTVWVSKRHNPRIKGARWTVDNAEVVKHVDMVVIAVKPLTVQSVLHELQPHLKKNHIVISIAAGLPLKTLARWAGGHPKIVRVMPNLATQVSEGMSVWKATPGVKKSDKREVQKLLSSFGRVLELASEEKINSAGAVCGCGPAFVAALLESFERFAVRNGFKKSNARSLALQTVLGSAKYLKETGIDFGELKQAVQTKGGSTEAAFKILIKKHWQDIFEKALARAKERTEELGR